MSTFDLLTTKDDQILASFILDLGEVANEIKPGESELIV